MPLNLHLLRLFAAVARSGSFSRAAEALHVSQPAVSRGVREFEAQVGARLLERGSGPVRLTEAGQRLARHAEALFATERAAEEDLATLRGLSGGSLSIGASTTIATYLLPPLLGAFHRAHPQVTLRVTSANTQAIAALLHERALDIALVEGPVSDPGFEILPWRPDTMVAIAAPDHPLLEGPPSSGSVLNDHLLILREPGSGSREVVQAALAAHGITPRNTMEVGSTETAKQLVAAGVGIAIVSAAAATDQIALGRLAVLQFVDFAVPRMLTRLSLPGRQPSPAATAFEALLAAPAAASVHTG